MYAKIENNTIVETKTKLGWLDENQDPISDEVYAQHNWYKIIANQPTVTWPDYFTQNDKSQWVIDDVNHEVQITYTTLTYTNEEIKNSLYSQIETKFQEKKAAGVTWNNEVWSLSDEARLNYAGLYARIQAGRGLPNNATSIKIIALNNQRILLDSSQIESLSESVSDYWASLMEAYGDKMEEVALAVDPLTVDINSGWPT